MVLKPRPPSVYRNVYNTACFRLDWVINIILVVIVIITQAVVAEFVFDCPCVSYDLRTSSVSNHTYGVVSGRVHYGVAFIIWPAIAFFSVALLGSSNIHRCLTGTRAGRRGCLFLVRSCALCVLSPIAWVICALIDGRYIACIHTSWPTKCFLDEDGVILAGDKKLEIIANNNSLKATSQIIGMSLLSLILLFSFLVNCCRRLCGSSSYFEERHMDNFKQEEIESFDYVSKELSRVRLERQWRMFLTRADQEDWEDIADLPLRYPHRLNNRTFYSPFDVWSCGKGYKKIKAKPPVNFDDYESSDMTDSNTVTLESDTTADEQLAKIPHKKRPKIKGSDSGEGPNEHKEWSQCSNPNVPSHKSVDAIDIQYKHNQTNEHISLQSVTGNTQGDRQPVLAHYAHNVPNDDLPKTSGNPSTGKDDCNRLIYQTDQKLKGDGRDPRGETQTAYLNYNCDYQKQTTSVTNNVAGHQTEVNPNNARKSSLSHVMLSPVKTGTKDC